MDIETRIANNLILLRKQNGFTQSDIADKMGISRVSYIGLEKGYRLPSLRTLRKIADIYDISIEQLTEYRQRPNVDKFEQIYTYILKYYETGIAKDKLSRLLYLIDFGAYSCGRSPMSGVKYIHKHFGPMADIFLEITDKLWTFGKISVELKDEGVLVVSSRSFNDEFDLISDEERRFIIEICDAWRDRPTNEVSNYTREQKPWRMTKEGEDIPYELILEEDTRYRYLPVD